MNEDAEGTPQMVRVGEGLKLAEPIAGPLTGCPFMFPGLRGDVSKELLLEGEGFGLEAEGVAGGLEGGEVDVGGDVLGAGLGEDIGVNLVVAIGAQGSGFAFRPEELVGAEAIIKREQPAASQGRGGCPPPVSGGRTNLGGETVGEEIEQLGRGGFGQEG